MVDAKPEPKVDMTSPEIMLSFLCSMLRRLLLLTDDHAHCRFREEQYETAQHQEDNACFAYP
jgi:hypothetical protein